MKYLRRPVTGPTPKPSNVRFATKEDETAILDLLRIDFAENARHVAPLSEHRIKDFVQTATRHGRATIAVIDGPDDIVGMIYLCPERWWWAEGWYIAERLTFVHPDHRSSWHAAHLLRFARWFVDEMSREVGTTIYLIAGVVATQTPHEKVALFSRFLNYAGGVFVYPNPAITD